MNVSTPAKTRRTWHLGIDTGGTFTDLVAWDGNTARISKVPSTPPHFDRGILNAIASAGIVANEIAVLAHGTTVATNALITREGSRIALLATQGFRDVLELRRHDRGELYDISWDPPAPIASRRDRFEVRERINYAGEVLERLCESDVRIAVTTAARRGISSFAVAYLHSYANPHHEARTREIILDMIPEASVYCSAEALREPGEFERTATVAANAFLGPVVTRYLQDLSRTLEARGFTGRLFVMHSGGGLVTAETAGRAPARLVTSGPAAGAMAVERLFAPEARPVAARGKRPILDGGPVDANLISLDMGGTSADIAVIRKGEARLAQEYHPEFGLPIRFPAVDLTTIGAGGGSIADVDEGGLPVVGPKSAGAVPGPAAYGLGGSHATVSDANVVLGRLSSETPLAGGISLDADAAHEVVAAFGRNLAMPPESAALGIVEITNRNMAQAIRLVTVERGLDPRRFSLVAFGGAGGLHAAELAAMLDIPRVLVPVSPGVMSALGCLFVDVVHDASHAYISSLDEMSVMQVDAIFRELDDGVDALLELDGVAPINRTIERSIDLRYEGQRRSLTLPVGAREITAESATGLRAAFLAAYREQFHYAATELAIEIVALRVRGRGDRGVAPHSAAALLRNATATTIDGFQGVSRTVICPSGPETASLVARSTLITGQLLAGPAIVHEYDSTVWVPPGWECTSDETGTLTLNHTHSAATEPPGWGVHAEASP